MNKLLVALIATLCTLTAQASPETVIRDRLITIDPNMPILSIEASALDSFYAVTLATGELLYVDAEAEFILSGDLYQINGEGGVVNLTDQALNGYRQSELAEVSDEDLIIYPAAGEKKARVLVFTDVDCPYCRRLHEEVPELNELGVEVAYLAFPRSGPEQPTAIEMEKIWCQSSDDERRDAMDASKAGLDVEGERCTSPVIDQLQLGQRLGVTGTPALVFEDGSLVPGYVPAARLKQMLNL